MSLVEQVRRAGVVGAGGAGFPTHVKLDGRADTVIANGAECEPLLYKDTELMIRRPERVVAGLRQAMAAVGATRGVVAVKKKREKAIAALEPHIAAADGVELLLLGDYYPSGDEYELVHAATGRLIPAGGIPLQVGVVVSNVESLVWIADAAEDRPAIDKFFSVNGEVAKPKTFVAPLGTPFGDILEFCGGATCPDPVALVGGVMMARFCDDFSQPVTRTTGGLVVLDRSHELIRRKTTPAAAMMRIGKSACDQCSYCTELCPRYLLGYDVQPHKVMRSLEFVATGTEIWSQWGQLCCACGICTLYACPEGLFPKEACDQAKVDLKAAGIRWTGRDRELKPHPMQEYRRLPVRKLIQRLGIARYDVPAPWTDEQPSAQRYVYPLNAHVGAPAVAQVVVGQPVERGDVLAEIATDQLGARVHTAVNGIVRDVWPAVVIERVS